MRQLNEYEVMLARLGGDRVKLCSLCERIEVLIKLGREDEAAELQKQRLWLDCRIRGIERALGDLDEDEARVLDLFYINRIHGASDRLCEILCVERSHVYRIKQRALEKFSSRVVCENDRYRL